MSRAPDQVLLVEHDQRAAARSPRSGWRAARPRRWRASRASTTSAATSQRSIWSRAIPPTTCSVQRVDRAPAAHAGGVDQHVLAPAERERRCRWDRAWCRAASCTSTRSSPSRQLTSDDLPTFGLPDERDADRAVRRRRRRGGGCRARRPRTPPPRAAAATTASRNWPTPRPWLADTGNTSGNPSANASAAAASRLRCRPCSAAISTGLPDLRSSLRDLAVDGGHALARVDDERHDVGLVQRAQRLLPHRRQDARRPSGSRPPVSTTRKRAGAPVADAVAAIAGDARLVLDQRRLPADQAVEQRRLADVRPPDQRDQRQRVVLGAASLMAPCIRSAPARRARSSSRGGP